MPDGHALGAARDRHHLQDDMGSGLEGPAQRVHSQRKNRLQVWRPARPHRLPWAWRARGGAARLGRCHYVLLVPLRLMHRCLAYHTLIFGCTAVALPWSVRHRILYPQRKCISLLDEQH